MATNDSGIQKNSGSGATMGGSSGSGDTGRTNSLTQRVAQWKQQVRSYPRNRKVEKLAVYSSCKVPITGNENLKIAWFA